MSRKIFLFIFPIFFNAVLAQLPTGRPPNFGSNVIPSLPANGAIPSLPSPGGIPGGGLPSFPFPGLPNPNWSRPSLSSTSEVWQKYFKQLQAARKELLQSLNAYQNSNKTANAAGSEIKPPNIKIPTPPPFLSGQSFTLLPQIQNAVSQFINQARPPPGNGRPQRVFPGNNPLALLLPPGLLPQFGNSP